MEIQDTKTVWVAYSNTDCTEGRGHQYPIAVCETEATARRMGAKKYVMGSDCPVNPETAVRVNNTWLYPGVLEKATAADKAAQVKADAMRSVVERMKAAGFTDYEIKSLK